MVKQHYIAWFLLSLLVACAGLAKPETIRQQTAYVEGGLTAAYQTIGDLRFRQRISVETRDKLIAQADTVGHALDATHAALASGNEAGASNTLSLARAALLALEEALKQVDK